MLVKSLRVGMVSTNCYIVINNITLEALIIDPGDEAAKIIDLLRENNAVPKAILLTHAHFDHIGAVQSLKKNFDIPLYCSREEKEVLENPMYNLSEMGGKAYGLQADNLIDDGQVLNLIGYEIKCILTPGHTIGGMCFYFEKEGVLFSGDTLFWESIGRTDFPGGHMGDLIRSVKNKLFVLPDDTVVYPGHDIPTTIGHEKENNMFIS